MVKVRLIVTLGIIGILMSGLGLAAGCTTITGGGFKGLPGLAGMAPAGTSMLFYIDMKRLREDTKLGWMYQDLEDALNGEFGDLGIRPSDIRHIGAIAMDFGGVTVIVTDQDLDLIREKLAEDGQRGDYLGTELWPCGYGQALAIYDGNLLTGAEDSVKACLDAIRNKNTAYESNADIRHVLLRLSDGLLAYLMSGDEFLPTTGTAVLIVERVGTASLIERSVMKFASESGAADAEAEIKASLDDMTVPLFNISVSRSGQFVEYYFITEIYEGFLSF